MRTSITLGKLRGSAEFEFVFGPDTSMEVQRVWLKEQRQTKRHDRYDEVQLWVSDTGRTIIHRFRQEAPAVATAPAVTEPPVEPQAEVQATDAPVVEPPAEPTPSPEPASEDGDAAADFDVRPAGRRGRARR